ncbi:MAG: hypothetical protein KDI79_19595 [Anaerolineae bacterium]|nr:hypothetical protein [Anaerolineae bacterium]
MTEAIDHLEPQDIKKVEQALQMLEAGDPQKAEALLNRVIQNTPNNYIYQWEENDTLFIKFWDQAEFVHYATWQKQQDITKTVYWIKSAYPRAYYYLGFLSVKTQQYERALTFLNRGHDLEPTNPKFNLEKAHVHLRLGQLENALDLYHKIDTIGPHVSARDVAVAMRGRGFVLIEMKKLDEAEAMFKQSLEFEPANKVALNELRYIEHLRHGGSSVTPNVVATQGNSISNCVVCGQQTQNGIVINVSGMAVTICPKCKKKYTKKWWQFWK